LPYSINITLSGELYFRELYEGLQFTYSLEKANKEVIGILEFTNSLNNNPYRDASKKQLKHLSDDYRFVLYDITKRNQIKIIFFIEESTKTIYITDFFPCSMNPNKIMNR